jgi:putative ABC transport system substrate-binding protein
MNRRNVTLLTGTALATPRHAIAQQGGRMRRIGVLTAYADDDPEIKARHTGFRQGLEKLGWSEGRNVRIDYRFGPTSSNDHAQVSRKSSSPCNPT